MKDLFGGVYKGKKVLLTGHTGFKGSWLGHWLEQLGAEVLGFSLPAPSEPAHFEVLKSSYESVLADIRDDKKLNEVVERFQPDMVFHLAAQPLVRDSYKIPVETFETNVVGSLKVYEAVRRTKSVKSIITITTDKVYENYEWDWGYRESDRLGGKDPYSASKACMEIMTASYRNSFFHIDKFGKDHNVLMASVRAGNVIGGGDWANDRLIPDIVRSVEKGEEVVLRNPSSTRPWQHVLEPLSGYLMVGQKLLERNVECAQAWNLGPATHENLNVEEVLSEMAKSWPKVKYRVDCSQADLHEAGYLKLDCTKALLRLHWKQVWNVHKALEKTSSWYKAYLEDGQVKTQDDLDTYIRDAKELGLAWTR